MSGTTGLPRIADYPGFLDAWGALAKAPRKSDAPTLVSLYAGAGGSSTGYRMAGFDVRLGVDFWDLATRSYAANWGDDRALNLDLTDPAAPERIARAAGLDAGQLDVLDSSEPCQGVSLAGKRQLDDPRNRLFHETGRVVERLRPKVWIRENVSGMIRGKMRPLFREVTEHMRNAGPGYEVRVKLLDASWLGVPQERNRIIWVGVRKDLARGDLAEYHPGPTWRQVSLEDGLAGLASDLAGGVYRGAGNHAVWNALGDGLDDVPVDHTRHDAADPAPPLPAGRPHKVQVKSHMGGGVPRGLDRPAMTISGSEPPRMRRPGPVGLAATKETVEQQVNQTRHVPRGGSKPSKAITAQQPPRLRRIQHKGGGNENDAPGEGPALRVRDGGEPANALGYRAPRIRNVEVIGPAHHDAGRRLGKETLRRKPTGGDQPAPSIVARRAPKVRAVDLEVRRSHGGATAREPGRPGPTTTGKAAPQIRMREVAHGFKPESLREPDRPAPAITTDPWDREVDDGGGWRRMTPQECMRLQSVPDWYRLEGAATHQIRQVGNMVPPLMSAQVGICVARRILGWEGAPKPHEVSRPWTA